MQIDLITDWSKFSLAYTCLIVLAIVLLLTAPRDTMYIKRINAFGVVFIICFLTFIIITGLKSASSTNYVYTEE